MSDETPTSETPKTQESSLSGIELAVFIDQLKKAADHSLGADPIKQLPGFQRLSEGEQALIVQLADRQKADHTLRGLENEWRRWSFDHIIAPKLQKHTKFPQYSSDADIAFYSVLSLASERRWDTLKTLLRTAAQFGQREAHKEWKRGDEHSIWSLGWQILWSTIEVAFIVYLLASIQHGFPAVVVSLLVLIYALLRHQISEIGFMVFLGLGVSWEKPSEEEAPEEQPSEEDRRNRARNFCKRNREFYVTTTALAVSEVIALFTLVVKGLL